MHCKELAITARAGIAALLFACAPASESVHATADSTSPSPATSAEARAVFEHAKDKLLQVRVIHKATRARAATGTGFVATADGLVLTNYHLVRKIALEPQDHALELEFADGTRITPRLVAIDVGNDLAVLATDRTGQPFLTLSDTWLARGARAFAMGYRRDGGTTIVEGTYEGYAETALPLQFGFAGAIDPGMSGGPVVTPDGQVLGVSVARRAGNPVMSYFVPAKFAVGSFLARAAKAKVPPTDFRKEVVAQVSEHQSFLYDSLFAFGAIGTTATGHYIVPDTRAAYARCQDISPKFSGHELPRSARTCLVPGDLFVDDDLQTGALAFRHERFEKGFFQSTMAFADSMNKVFADGAPRAAVESDGEALTGYRCHDGFVRRPGGALRVALCLRAYRDFAGLYDLHLRALTVDSASAALLGTLTVTGVSFKDGQKLAKKYLEAITWTH